MPLPTRSRAVIFVFASGRIAESCKNMLPEGWQSQQSGFVRAQPRKLLVSVLVSPS